MTAELLREADPARDLQPEPEIRDRTRARLDALIAADAAPPPRRARRPRALIAAGLATFLIASAGAVVAAGLPGDGGPAQAFADRLQGDGIVHMVLAHERTHDASGDGVNPRQDELWVSLADGSWRVRIRLYGNYIDYTFDGRTTTVYDSRTGRTTTDTPKDPSLLVGRPFAGSMSPSAQPLNDVAAGDLRVAGETTIDGEPVYDLVPAKGVPAGIEIHWYVTRDGELKRMMTSAADTVDPASGSVGPSSLTTDVESYDVLAPTPANAALLRPQPR
jgi:hypothetical protein